MASEFFYFDGHPPSHFDACYAAFVAQIGMDTLKIIKGSLPRPQLRMVQEWALPTQIVARSQ
jgi:hypothetical protein